MLLWGIRGRDCDQGDLWGAGKVPVLNLKAVLRVLTLWSFTELHCYVLGISLTLFYNRNS